MFLLELEVLEGGKIYSRVFTLSEGGKVAVGRQQCDLPLIDRSVSRKHMTFQVRDAKLVASDMKSTTGTRKNGQPLKQDFSQKGDVFEVGPYLVRVRKFTASRRAEPTMGEPVNPTMETSTFLIPLVGPNGVVPQAMNRIVGLFRSARGWKIAATAALLVLVVAGVMRFNPKSPERQLASQAASIDLSSREASAQ